MIRRLSQPLFQVVADADLWMNMFATALAEQFVRLCQSENFDVFSVLDGSARNVMRLLAEKHPAALWQPLSHFYELASALERHWLERLVGPSDHGENVYTEGVLFKIPESQGRTRQQSVFSVHILSNAYQGPGGRLHMASCF